MAVETPPGVAALDLVIRSYLLPVVLGHIDRERPLVENSATAFLFRPADRPILVTADHVAVEAERLASSGRGPWVGVGSCRIKLANRLIDHDGKLDIATFRVTDNEVSALGVGIVPAGSVGWPAPPPSAGDLITIAGFPGQERTLEDDGTLDFGTYIARIPATDVGSHRINLSFNYQELRDYCGQGLPSPGYRLGGLSGGPALVFEKSPLLTWRLCGVISTHAHMAGQELVQLGRADYIGLSGEIGAPP